jgi:hypothetical protein
MHKSPLYLIRQLAEKKWRRLKRNITMLIFSRYTLFISLLLFSMVSFAQNKVEMADSMRSNGKIYVVVAVCLTILIGLFIYVFLLDKKISRFEKNNE